MPSDALRQSALAVRVFVCLSGRVSTVLNGLCLLAIVVARN